MPSTRRVAIATWTLIFGGLLTFGFGLTLARSEFALGVVLVVASVVAVLAGAALVWVRSRMETPIDANPSSPRRSP
jgi:hypothetical protein